MDSSMLVAPMLLGKRLQLKLKHSPVTEIEEPSYTKLLVFGEISNDWIIYLDADSVLLAVKLLDELFFIPPCQVARYSCCLLVDR